MVLDGILAQEEPLSALRRALSNQRVAQAYLFEGPSGVGKQKTALALASAMNCSAQPQGCGQCEICTRIAAGNHPDVRVFEPRKEGDRNIKVEFVREEILPFTRFAPFESGHAFLIFPEADVSFPAHHAQAANALLKTLEEPRANLHFVLLAERPDRLLPTIRSRCQRVRFSRLPPDIVKRILEAEGVPESARHAATALAGGRADRAIELAQEQKGEQLLELALRVDACVAEGKPAPLLDLGEELARNDDLPLILETMALFYRDVAAASLGLSEDELVFGHQPDIIRERAGLLDARRAASRVSSIYRTSESLERNANTEIALDAMLFELGSV